MGAKLRHHTNLILQLVMEWGTLSKHTGNDTYRQLAEKSSRHIATLVSSAH